MTGRRQVWAGFTLFLLSLALPVWTAATLSLTRPGAGWQAATLIAAALVLALVASRALAVAVPAAPARAGAGPDDAIEAPLRAQFSPDAPGRPRPRAPGGSPGRASSVIGSRPV